MDYPEHGKLRAVRDATQAAGEFVEWLTWDKGMHIATTDDVPCSEPIQALLAEWKGIDREALEAEKLAMLAVLRAAGDASP